MNALAVKTQIWDRLRQRKFELERIERAYWQTIGDQRLRSHAEASRRAMRGAIVPHYIPREGLFELNVDDDIWQDVGLADDEVDPPAWLADDRVWAGIRDLLERDRCEEEEVRLQRERCNLQEWSRSEWEAVVHARDIHCKHNRPLARG
ncbi:hypothetical protein HYDPIDRAFT_31672 [Hydnomerulius pinastri MD-312]|uniref:Uncharacterized protein n=1 Tax=Hydnomerulius pinastri MD-312 TaxID=994086 RepID=A0A0C9W482_9AGAM|nr:hypothetical protein HYDPIDRAFT_31672 [Hydnomerulius pinastri MD-312]